MLLQGLLLIVSIVLLYYGAEFALDGAERVGKFLGMSPLVIGLLIVGFGTSLPEFFVSQLSSYRGMSGIAFGNIVGSNIANLFLVLGVSGLLAKLNMQRGDIRNQLVLHLILTLLLTGVLYRGKIDLISTGALGIFFLGYLFNTLNQMKKNPISDDGEDHESIHWLVFVKLILGFALLYGGGELLVSSGSKLGIGLGISEYVISAIFVAFGTSFPELVTALIACYKKKDHDLITGNIIGSNIFNVSFVLSSLGFYNITMSSRYLVEAGFLIGAAIILLLISSMKRDFYRIAGGSFLACYLGVIYFWVA